MTTRINTLTHLDLVDMANEIDEIDASNLSVANDMLKSLKTNLEYYKLERLFDFSRFDECMLYEVESIAGAMNRLNKLVKEYLNVNREKEAYCEVIIAFLEKNERLTAEQRSLIKELNVSRSKYANTPVETFVPSFSSPDTVRINKLGMVMIKGNYESPIQTIDRTRTVLINGVETEEIITDRVLATVETEEIKPARVLTAVEIEETITDRVLTAVELETELINTARYNETNYIKRHINNSGQRTVSTTTTTGWYDYQFKSKLSKVEYQHFTAKTSGKTVSLALHVEVFKTFMKGYTKAFSGTFNGVLEDKVRTIIVDHIDSGPMSRYNNQLTCLRQIDTSMNSLNSTRYNTLLRTEINFINTIELDAGLWFDEKLQMFISHNGFNYYLQHQYTETGLARIVRIINSKQVNLGEAFVIGGKSTVITTDLEISKAAIAKIPVAPKKLVNTYNALSDIEFNYYLDLYNNYIAEDFIQIMASNDIVLTKKIILKYYGHLIQKSGHERRIFRTAVDGKLNVTIIKKL